jgi:hypothetical protein
MFSKHHKKNDSVAVIRTVLERHQTPLAMKSQNSPAKQHFTLRFLDWKLAAAPLNFH